MSEHMDYEEEVNEDVTLVKYSIPVLVIKNPEKPVSSGGNLKVYVFLLLIGEWVDVRSPLLPRTFLYTSYL